MESFWSTCLDCEISMLKKKKASKIQIILNTANEAWIYTDIQVFPHRDEEYQSLCKDGL